MRGNNALKDDRWYTVKDYRAWGDDERWELIDGVAYSMSPAPRVAHQRLLLELGRQLADFFNGKPCEVFIAPIDVFISGTDSDQDDTVVQPDLMVVCDSHKVQDKGIYGAPDWICEVLSPATIWKDQTEKRNLYERFGVREYWVLNPDTLDLLMYEREGDHFKAPGAASLKDPVPLALFPQLTLTAGR